MLLAFATDLCRQLAGWSIREAEAACPLTDAPFVNLPFRDGRARWGGDIDAAKM